MKIKFHPCGRYMYATDVVPGGDKQCCSQDVYVGDLHSQNHSFAGGSSDGHSVTTT